MKQYVTLTQYRAKDGGEITGYGTIKSAMADAAKVRASSRSKEDVLLLQIWWQNGGLGAREGLMMFIIK